MLHRRPAKGTFRGFETESEKGNKEKACKGKRVKRWDAHATKWASLFYVFDELEGSETMKKKVMIGDKEVLMTATSATPLHYRNQFPNHDLFKELQANEGKALEDIDYSVFERMAYIMSGAFKEGISLEEWLEQFK